MSTATPSTPVLPLFDDAPLGIASFLARYSGPTRTAYATDLRQYVAWCADQRLGVFAARRAHVGLWARWMEERGLAGHRRPAHVHRSPAFAASPWSTA